MFLFQRYTIFVRLKLGKNKQNVIKILKAIDRKTLLIGILLKVGYSDYSVLLVNCVNSSIPRLKSWANKHK